MHQVAWPGDREGTFWLSSLAATCSFSTTHGGSCTIFRFNADSQTLKLKMPIFSLRFDLIGNQTLNYRFVCFELLKDYHVLC